MSKIIWDEVGKRLYETGVRNGVLYPQNSVGGYPKGVAWNGLISVSESPSGAEPTPIYADDGKYLTLMSAEEFGATVEAYTYPDEFALCDGSAELAPGVSIGQQSRTPFGLVYRTSIGNDTEGVDHGYKLHLIYGAMASPSEKAYQTVNDSPEAITFSWELTTTPVEVPGKKPTASLTIDSTKVDAAKLKALETILFGSANTEARLPLPAEIEELFKGPAPAELTLSSSVPAADATNIAISAPITLTFNNKLANENIVLMTDAGVIVDATKTKDGTGKILTIKSKAALTAATKYMVVISGVVDVHNQSLATIVRKFTTAAA